MQARIPSKTPYEIRLDLLSLAQNILDKQHSSKAVFENGGLIIKTAATSEEIIAEAEKLNQFISKSN